MRRGRKRALLAVAHSILTVCYFMIKNGSSYSELGADYFNTRNKDALVRHNVSRLERLGDDVTIIPKLVLQL